MPETAKERGMEVNNILMSVTIGKINTRSLSYLLKAKRKFGTWTLAAASYNRGMAGVRSKWISKESNYYDYSYEETCYVFRILA
jgi:hypothetical protein